MIQDLKKKKITDNLSVESKAIQQKKFLDFDGLSHLVTLIMAFIKNYASPKNHNHDTEYAKTNHTHTTAQVSGLDAALASKAASNHTHNSIVDAGDGRTLTFNYSADGLANANWYAAWNGSSLQSISKANLYEDTSARTVHHSGDMNSFVIPGTYVINNKNSMNNFPNWMYYCGILQVFKNGNNVAQLFIPDSHNKKPWFRTADRGGWRKWTMVSTSIQAYFGSTVMDVYGESAGHNAGNARLMSLRDFENITGCPYDCYKDNVLIMNGDRDASWINASGVAYQGSSKEFWVQGGLWGDWKGTHCRINWCIITNSYKTV